MFNALAENFDNMREKVKVFVALAPVVRLDNITDPTFVDLAKNVDTYHWWLDAFGIDEILGSNWLIA